MSSSRGRGDLTPPLCFNGNETRPKDAQANQPIFIMSVSVMTDLLAQGQTGNEILEILEAITEDYNQEVSDTTA